VVRNVCVGATQTAAGITLTPAAINFGSFTQESLPGINERRELILENKSTQTLTITNIALTGQDSGAFRITELAGKPFDATLLPFSLSPRSSRKITVEFAPNNLLPSDGSFDASLTISSTDEEGANAETTGLLVASIEAIGLEIDVIDAGRLVTEVTDTSNLTQAGHDLAESDISVLGDPGNARRIGFVADGNARLLLRVQTTVQKEIEFSIPSHIGATLEGLGRNKPANGAVLTIPVANVVDISGEKFQATAVLIAPERFPGQANEREVEFDITVRVKNTDGTDATSKLEKIRIRRAPVVLIHGLWADAGSWTDDKWVGADEGMRPALEKSELFRVRTFNYDNWRGPSETMTEREVGLAAEISLLCRNENNDKFACTRSDIVGHSMGGLVARKFIKDNTHYQRAHNYKQGSVRRLVTLGTPHSGSGFASLLRQNNADIGYCITSPLSVENHIKFLNGINKRVDSAITDLAYNSALINQITGPATDPLRVVNAFPIVGDTGEDIEYDSDDEIAGCTHANLFHGEHSDNYVSLSSATGGLNVSTLLVGVKHVGMGVNPQVVRETISRLNGPIDDFSRLAKVDQKPSTVFFAKAQAMPEAPRRADDMMRKIGAALLGLMGISSASAETLPTAILSVNSTNPQPGSSVVFH
jgi:pimeloyl-ACP methyl ester carboxylesterase